MVENKMGAELTQKVDAKQKSGSILDHQFSLSVIDKSRSFNSSGYSSLYIRRSSSAPVKKLSQPVGNNAVMIKTEGKGTTNQLESTHAHTEDCTDQQQDNLIDGVQACSNTKLVAGFVGMEIYSKTSDASTLLHSQSSPVTYAEARQSSPVTYAEASKFSLLSLSQPDLSESCEQSSNTSLNSDSLLGSMGSDFNLTSSSLATITPLTNVSSWSDLELATQQHEIGRVDEDDVNCGSTNHENGMKQNLVNNVGKDNGIKECKDEHNSSKTTLSGHTAHLQCSLSCPEIYNKYGEIQVGSLQKLDEGNPKTFSLIKRSQSLDALMQNASCINGGDLTVPIALHTVIPESSRTRVSEELVVFFVANFLLIDYVAK